MISSQETRIKDYEKKLHHLLGESIVEVNYYELKYDEPLWDEGVYHCLDFGLEFTTENREQYYFIWGKEFTQFDVKFERGSIVKEFLSIEVFCKYNVTNTFYWRSLAGIAIENIRVNWSYWSFVGKEGRCAYPQDVIITFERNSEVIISAMEIVDEKAVEMKDHITIFFDKSLFQKMKIKS
ncbi:hypothetical protein [Kordia sp.]|uniref:hypothetical protein n=1 Tax=Kordia sp. TaxID=1965332 RepID=UPI0025BDF993|nr:hypothetical protein [Kordia sp.]MCH2192939.1 hypothetical protein [Kordia sp.]